MHTYFYFVLLMVDKPLCSGVLTFTQPCVNPSVLLEINLQQACK
jgi:hypothetical protein